MDGRSLRRESTFQAEKSNLLGWPDWADSLAVADLRDTLRTGQIGHAYLLDGPGGVGKSALASAFAQAICCTNLDAGDPSLPCSACRACRNVGKRAHPDVEWFDLDAQTSLDKDASHTSLSIDTVRRLRESAGLFPLEADRRVIVIDDAETLLEPAQQAILKTLEEPPAAVTILVLCDDAEALLETVRSRCQTVRVRPVSQGAIAQSLIGRGVDEDEARRIAVLSRGAGAWAIDAAADIGVLKSRTDEHEMALAWVMADPYERLVTAFKLGEQFGKRRSEVLGIVLAAIHVLRERMIEAANGGSMGSAAGGFCRALEASLQCLADLDANVRPRLAMEAMVMEWPKLDRPSG